jgi:hypothetical protein
VAVDAPAKNGSAAVSLPSCQLSLPQQKTLPVAVSAHAKLPPAATAVMVVGSPITATGDTLNLAPVGAPLPS